MKGSYQYLALDRVHFGRPAAEVILEEADARDAERVYVVTSRTLNQTTSAIRDAVAPLGSRVVGVFDACVEHTPRETVLELAEVLRGANADLVVTIGGGTAIDTSKMALLALAQDVRSVEAFDDWHIRVSEDGGRVVPEVGAPPCRQIVVPTTLSAAEFSDLAGCTDRARGQKHLYHGKLIGSATSILDPAITLHTPERLWLSTGVRAIDHAVESICSIDAQPLTDATCTDALARLAQALPASKRNPSDLDLRLQCQLGVWLSASGIGRINYGASHGLGHVLGAAAGVPHGITSCVLLPAVLRYNAEVIGGRFERIRIALSAGDQDPADALRELIGGLGLPTRISELNVSRDMLPEIAEKGLENPWVRANPRTIATAADAMQVLELAW